MSQLEIKRVTRTDLQEVISLNEFSMPEHYLSQFWTLIYNRYGDMFFVAKFAGKVIGYVTCKEEEVNNYRTGIIVSIAVAEPYRKMGIGEALMFAAHRAMRERGIRMAGLQVRKSNEKAIRMYDKLGYVIAMSIPFYYHGPDEDGWLLTTVL